MENKFGLLPSDISAIIGVLQKDAGVQQAIIFGSRAKGNYKQGSDVDIALFGDEKQSFNLSNIQYLLNEELPLPYKFDVLNYHTLSNPLLKEHINRVGKLLYEKV